MYWPEYRPIKPVRLRVEVTLGNSHCLVAHPHEYRQYQGRASRLMRCPKQAELVGHWVSFSKPPTAQLAEKPILIIWQVTGPIHLCGGWLYANTGATTASQVREQTVQGVSSALDTTLGQMETLRGLLDQD
jgi:hypothetical protein